MLLQKPGVPEGGAAMLKASRIPRDSVSWGTGTTCERATNGSATSNCTAGPGCCEWQDDDGCLAAPQPFLKISLGIAATMTDFSGKVLPPMQQSTVIGATSAHNSYRLKAGVTVVLRLVIETTRPPVVAHTSALDAAVALSKSADLPKLEAATAAFWEAWWNASSLDLGPGRRNLEGFYYGAQYMLACFSRPNGVAAGLLGASHRSSFSDRLIKLRRGLTLRCAGPWSLQDPVGWSDHLTTDYNVEANYWGAASSNRVDAMLPYFPTMNALMPECRKRAALKTWGRGAHASYNTWGQGSEMMGCGPTSFSVMGGCPDSMGGYEGLECPSAMGFVAELTSAHDSSTRFVAALMTTPYIEYYEVTMDAVFLREHAFPWVEGSAEFYASYATKNASSGKYDLLYTCAQEICQQRQAGHTFVNHNSLIDLAHAKMVLLKASEYSLTLGLTDAASAAKRSRWDTIAANLADLPLTTDNASFPGKTPPSPLTGTRKVWSESLIEPSALGLHSEGTGANAWAEGCELTDKGLVMRGAGTACVLEPAKFATNYMYPIIHFSAIHPGGLVGLHSDVYSGNDTAAHAALLKIAQDTVWGDNERSSWKPVNGLCLAWPSATRVTDGAVAGASKLLLDRFESALHETMMPNFWPSMSGGGTEQVGATLAINELLLQSHEGFLVLYPAWGAGSAASFTTLRARGAFLVSAAIDATRTVAAGVRIVSEAGTTCRMLSPWKVAPRVVDGTGAAVAVRAEVVRGIHVHAFDTKKGSAYLMSPTTSRPVKHDDRAGSLRSEVWARPEDVGSLQAAVESTMARRLKNDETLRTHVLSNDLIVAEVDAATGSLLSLAKNGSRSSSGTAYSPFRFSNDSWRVQVGNLTLSPESCRAARAAPQTAELSWTVDFHCDVGSLTAFVVQTGYRLWPGEQFVSRELRLCQCARSQCDGAISSVCDPNARFFIDRASVWDRLLVVGDTRIEGPHHNMNPYRSESVVASFWRRPLQADGLFVSLSNPFFESGVPPPPPPPAPYTSLVWGGHTWRTYNQGAKWDASLTTLSVDPVHAGGPGSDEAVLVGALPGGTGTATVSVEFSSQPKVGWGCAGLLLGAHAESFRRGANAFQGFEVSVSPNDGGSVLVAYHNEDSNQLKKVPAHVPFNETVVLEVSMTAPPGGQFGTMFLVSVSGKIVIDMILSHQKHLLDKPGDAVGLRAYETQATFSAFSVKPSRTTEQHELIASNQPMYLHYEPNMMHDAASMGPWHEIDRGVLGLTELTGYVLPETGTNLGEIQAFQHCVESFLLDRKMREKKALRYNAAWDCNEYQLDMSLPADIVEYKRIIDRNAEIGIPNQVFEPRNTQVSSRFNATDDWQWEPVLMFQMNEQFRTGKWSPGEPLPPTVHSMMEYFKQKHVRPTAYFYPILNFQHAGEDWLYPNAGTSGQRATLASVKLQNYLIESLGRFMNQTGAIGFAWDYTFFSDKNHSTYAQWRGWNRVTTSLQKARNGEMVCDNRQTAHQWGPWYTIAGSFSEPIAGDENPESYGAALASLSTDHVLANNLRSVNCKYRQQLLPNNRIPGFIFHQPERHYDNNTGTDKGHPRVWTRWHVRDFDHPGWKFSVWSTVATAPCNLISANIPARDQEENDAFSSADVDWWKGRYDWVDRHLRWLNKTMAIPGFCAPSIEALDGTAAMDGDEGFIFLFNSGPRPLSAALHVDEMLGLSNRSEGWSWLVEELYPNEPGHGGRGPIGVWEHGTSVEVEVGGTQARVLQLSRLHNGAVVTSLPDSASSTTSDQAFIFNMSYSQAIVVAGVFIVTNASALAGSDVMTLLAAHEKPTSVQINGIAVQVGLFDSCITAGLSGMYCALGSIHFDGEAITWSQQATDTVPPNDFAGGWFNTTFSISEALLAQLQRSQAEYPVNWTSVDMDATWLAPNRLLLYPYLVHPVASMAPVKAWVDDKPLKMLPAYNSRGNHDSKGCFLGFYANMTGAGITTGVKHTLALHMNLSALSKKQGAFLGVFWQNTRNEYTGNIVQSPTVALADDPVPRLKSDEAATATAAGLQGQPFEIFWNGPSAVCSHSTSGPLTLAPYGLQVNANQSFNGSQITLFYKMGLFPTLKGTRKASGFWQWGNITATSNGGVPQAADLEAHSASVEQDVIAMIPDPAFAGVLIVDYEAWRPLYSECYDSMSIYREFSRRLVLADPGWANKNASQVDAEASRRFNEGARQFYTQTVESIRSVRPHARIGFYSQGIDGSNSTGGMEANAKLSWLWELVDVLCPSIYPHSRNATAEASSAAGYIAGAIRSATMATAAGRLRPAVLPYARALMTDENPSRPFTPGVLAAQIAVAAGMGAEGVILWGAHANYAGGGCAVVQQELTSFAGPTMKTCIANRVKCATTHCSKNGRCVDYSPDRLMQTCMSEAAAVTTSCRCDDGFTGKDCSTTTQTAAAAAAAAAAAVDDRVGRIVRVGPSAAAHAATIAAGVALVPPGQKERWTVAVEAGTYRERVWVNSSMGPLTLTGGLTNTGSSRGTETLLIFHCCPNGDGRHGCSNGTVDKACAPQHPGAGMSRGKEGAFVRSLTPVTADTVHFLLSPFIYLRALFVTEDTAVQVWRRCSLRQLTLC
jgi:hyaluronoglucosaminidase